MYRLYWRVFALLFGLLLYCSEVSEREEHGGFARPRGVGVCHYVENCVWLRSIIQIVPLARYGLGVWLLLYSVQQ